MADIPFAIQKTQKEIQEMSPAELAAYDDLQRRIVFGHDSKVDDDDEPIEQGIGSRSHPSRNSIEAYKRWCNPHNPKCQNPDSDFDANLKRMEDELAQYLAGVKAKAARQAQKRKAA